MESQNSPAVFIFHRQFKDENMVPTRRNKKAAKQPGKPEAKSRRDLAKVVDGCGFWCPSSYSLFTCFLMTHIIKIEAYTSVHDLGEYHIEHMWSGIVKRHDLRSSMKMQNAVSSQEQFSWFFTMEKKAS